MKNSRSNKSSAQLRPRSSWDAISYTPFSDRKSGIPQDTLLVQVYVDYDEGHAGEVRWRTHSHVSHPVVDRSLTTRRRENGTGTG